MMSTEQHRRTAEIEQVYIIDRRYVSKLAPQRVFLWLPSGIEIQIHRDGTTHYSDDPEDFDRRFVDSDFEEVL